MADGKQNALPTGMIIALDLIAACVIAHLFLDRWLAALLSEFRQSPAVLVLSFVPDSAAQYPIHLWNALFNCL